MRSFPEGMGYAGTAIPKTMKAMGVDVHYVTAGLPVYLGCRIISKTYGDFHARRDAPGTSRIVDGDAVHFLDYKLGFGGARLKGLREQANRTASRTSSRPSTISRGRRSTRRGFSRRWATNCSPATIRRPASIRWPTWKQGSSVSAAQGVLGSHSAGPVRQPPDRNMLRRDRRLFRRRQALHGGAARKAEDAAPRR